MEITQKLQPMQDKDYQLFTVVEGQGVELEQVVTTIEQCLEGTIIDVAIHKFTKKEAATQQQVEAT
jgi:hypothetical protein